MKNMNSPQSRKTQNMINRVSAMVMALLFAFTFACDSRYKIYAEEDTSDVNPSVRTDYEIFGSNSFGNLVASGFAEKNTEQLENNGFNVFSVEMIDTVAAVSFETTRDCTLLVGIYDNEGAALLTYGTAEVIAEETEAYIDINADAMPDYFYIKAYLIDTDTLRPLCSEYTSPMYTRNMQDFLSKTADDFDPNRVMNLDDREDTNFAVFNETTKLIPTVENVNEIVSADPETQTYVFKNADENITALKAGDIFAYNYNDEVLIVKVGSISIDGSNVTIIGQDTELDEVFEHLRIDGEAPTESAITDASELEEGIAYLGCTEDSSEISTYGIDLGGSASYSHKFTFGKTGDEYKDDTFTGKYAFSGSLDLKLEASAKVYISWGETYFEIKLNVSAKFVADFSAEAARKSIPLANFEIHPITGVYVRLKPAFIIEGKGQCKSDITFSWTTGFKASTNSGKQNLTSNPKVSLNSEATVTIFIGFSLEPELVILHKKIAEASLKGEAGVEIKATVVKASTDSKGVQHDCTSCIDGDISAKVNLTASIKLLNKENMKFDFKMVDVTVHLLDFYYSFDFNEFGFKECPHISYPFQIYVVDSKSAPIGNAKITAEYQARTATTDESGKATVMLPTGEQKFTVTAEGYNGNEATVKVGKSSDNARVTLFALGEKTPFELLQGHLNKEIQNGASNPEDVDYKNPDAGNVTELLQELKIKKIALGDNYSAAITTDGELYMWGRNEYGRLGNGTTTSSSLPIKVMDHVVDVSLGYFHCAAITTDGELYMWGRNYYGQLGNGTTVDSSVPVKVMDHVVDVSLGYDSAAITSDGELYMWGNNSYGQLGNGTTTDSSLPVKVMDRVAKVQLVANCSAAITSDGSLYMWGYNFHGQLGNGTTTNSSLPVKVMDHVAEVQLDGYQSAAITTDGEFYMWGWNGDGQLGNGTTDNSSVPVKVMDHVVDVSLWDYHSAAITSDGSLYMWGSNSCGQLGNGTTADSSVPVKVMDHVVDVSLGFFRSAAITSNGELYMWGHNYYGELGNGTRTITSSVPVKVMDHVAEVQLDEHHSAAITTDGALYMWGYNAFGQLGNGTTTDSSVPVKVNSPKAPISEANAYSLRAAPRTAAAYTDPAASRMFTNLIPNEIYNYYSVNSRAAKDMLSDDNLFYIGQAMSDSSGTLTVPDHVPNGKIFVKAMTEFDVYNAEITSAETAGNTVSLTWNPVDGASEYEVIRFTRDSAVSYPITSGTSISVSDLEGGDYGFAVTSIVHGEQSVPAMNDIAMVHIDEPVAVTFPASVTVTTMLDTVIHSGDAVSPGDRLRIEAIIPEGKKLTTLTVNGKLIINGSIYTVGTEDIVIEAVFEDVDLPAAPILSGIVITPGESETALATVEILDSSGNTVSTMTTSDGKFALDNLPNGTYTIRISRSKYAPREIPVVLDGSPISLDTELRLYGDIDGDGFVGASDATQILRYENGLPSAFDQDEVAFANYLLSVGNLSGDGEAPYAGDATQILRYENGLSSVFDRIA